MNKIRKEMNLDRRADESNTKISAFFDSSMKPFYLNTYFFLIQFLIFLIIDLMKRKGKS
jgi:hypothetical protein